MTAKGFAIMPVNASCPAKRANERHLDKKTKNDIININTIQQKTDVIISFAYNSQEGINIMFCPFCGKESIEGAVFCPSCGKAMPAKAEQQAQQQQQQPQQPQQTQQQQQTNQQQAQQQASQPQLPPYLAPPPQQQPYQAQTQTQQPQYQAQQQPPQRQQAYPPPPQLAPGIAGSTPSDATGGTPSGAAGGAKLSTKIKVMIAVAAAVVIIGGGVSAAYFSGALDNVFNKKPQVVASKDKAEETTTQTTTATTTTEQTTEATTTTTTTAATTTTTTAATTTEAKPAEEAAFARRLSPGFMTLLSNLKADAYISDDASPRGAVEESIVNLATGMFAGARNITSAESRNGGDVFNMEISVAIDVTDAYIDELTGMMFGGYIDTQTKDLIRVVGASEIKFAADIGGETENSMWRPMFGMTLDWLIKARSFISLAGYADMTDIFAAAPGLTDAVLRMESTLEAMSTADMDALTAQMGNMQKLGGYINDLMPYVNKMLIAAVKEVDVKLGGKEQIILGGKSISFDALDVTVTQVSAAKAMKAALTVLKNNPAALDIAVQAWNEVLADLSDYGQLNRMILVSSIDEVIKQLEDVLNNPTDATPVRARLYMNAGELAGIALVNVDSYSSVGMGAIILPESGYTLWYEDIDGAPDKDAPPSYTTAGGDRYEIYGATSGGANGISGDLNVYIKEGGDLFNEKLMSFSNLGVKVLYGSPVFTGSFSIKMKDLYSAFSGKDLYSNSFVSDMANALSDGDVETFLKDLEFTLDFNSTNKDYTASFIIANPAQKSKITATFKCGFTNKKIAPPSGMLLDVSKAEPNELMSVFDEVLTKLNAKIDALSAAGYDVAWVKPIITQYANQALGLGSDAVNFGGDSEEGDLTVDGGYFVFEDSSKKALTAKDLEDLSVEMLVIAQCEIYARHGMVFDDANLQQFFNAQDWYTPANDNNAIELNAIEEANVTLIASKLNEMGY